MRKTFSKILCAAITCALTLSSVSIAELTQKKEVEAATFEDITASQISSANTLKYSSESDDEDSNDDTDDNEDEDDEEEEEEIALKDCTITLEASSYNYTGDTIEPEVTVEYDDEELEEDEDYTVSFSNNIKIGKKAKITIKAEPDSNCTGTVTKYFTIKKGTQTISAKNASVKLSKKTYSLKAKLKSGSGKLTYTSSNKKIATVNTKGKLTLNKKGSVTITIKAKATTNYSVAKKKVKIKVK